MAQDKLSTLFSTLNSQGIYNDMSVDEFRAKMADSEKRATVYNGMRKWNIPGVTDTFEAFSADLGFAGADTGAGIAEQNARQLDALIEQYDGDREYAQQMHIRQNLSTSLDDMTARVQEAMRNITTPTRINPMFGFANNPERNELAALQSLIGNLQKELALPTEAEKEHGDKRSGLVAGLKTADLTSILTAGWSDAANQLRQSAALQKAAKGEPLSATDQMYVDLYELMQEAEANTQALGGTTSGANIGRGVAGSIPYVTGMIATSGVSGAARAYVSNAVKAIAPTGVKNFIDGAAKAAVGKAIGKKAIIKGVSTVGGAAVGALAALPLQSGMYSNFAQKTLEQYDVDAGVARLARPTSTFKRLYQSGAEAFTDIFTEQMGGLLTKSARFLGRELGSKASLFNKLGRFNSGRISQLAFFGGPIEEFEEELWAGFLSPLLSAKSAEERTESWRQMFSAQSLWETAMTTALMSGGFSVLDAADNAPATLRSRSLAKRSLSNIKDAGLRQTLYDGLHNKELETGVKDIASYDWSNASSGDMANAIDYVRFELNYQVRRGYATAQQSENEYLKKVVAAGESIYYGKDGNTPSSDIIIATTANGVYNVLAGDIDSTDPKATVIVRDAEGRRTQIANKEIQSVMSMPVSDYLSQAYAEIYGQVEQSVTPTQLQEDIADAQEAGVDPSAAISSQMDEAIEGSQFTLPDGRRGEVAALRPDGTVEINVLSSDGSMPIDNLEMGLQDVVPLIQAEDEAEAEAQKIATEISSLPESEQENATEPTIETTEQEITPNEPTVPKIEALATAEPILPEAETPVTTEPQVESTVEPTVAEQTEVETAEIESEPAPELNVQPESTEVDYSTMPAEKFAEAMLDINDSSEEAVQMVEDMRQANNNKLQAALSEYEAHKQNNKPTSPNELANYAAKRKELKATIEALQAEDKRLSDTLGVLSSNADREEVTNIPQTEEVDEYNNHFVLASDGSSDFGMIDAESGLQEAPIKLSMGDNTVDEKGKNHGYGLLHIEAERGDAIRAAGYNSVQDFVESVAKNYTDIREGGVIADNQTYLLELVDEHNNTLFIQLSKNGEYWTINSAGIFRKKYSRNKRKVYDRPALGSDTNTDISGVDSGHIDGVTTPAGNSPQTSESKYTTSEPISKETTEKSTDAPEQTTPEEPTTAPEPVVGPATEVVEVLQTEPETQPETTVESEPAPDAINSSPYADHLDLDTLTLKMSEEEFGELLSSNDAEAIKSYEKVLDDMLAINEDSPFAGEITIKAEYKQAVVQFGNAESVPAEVIADLNSRIAPYKNLSRTIYDRKYAITDKLHSLSTQQAEQSKEREKAIKADYKKSAYNGFLTDKSDLAAATADKALKKKVKLGPLTYTVGAYVESSTLTGNLNLATKEVPKYAGASRTAWNRMDAQQQAADAERVKNSGTKTLYLINDYDLGKVAYDYARYLRRLKEEGHPSLNPVQPKSEEEQMAEEAKARILKEGTGFDKHFDLIAPKDVAFNKDISNNVDTIISKLAEKQSSGEELGSYGGFVKVEGYDGNAYRQVKDYLVQLKKGIGELVTKWLQDNNLNDTEALRTYIVERYAEAYDDAVRVKDEQKSDSDSQPKVEANSVEEMYDKMLAAHGPIARAPLKRTFDLWAYTSDDKLRPGITGIYHNADRQEAVATDAHILVASKTDYDKKFAGKVIGTNGKEIPSAIFTNYTALNTNDKVSIDVNVENLKGILGGIKKEQKELWAKEKEEGKKPGAFKNFLSDTVVYIKLGNGKVSAFQLSLFEDFVVAMEHIGADKIYGSDPTRAIFAKSDKGLAMAMPRINTLVDMEWRDENLPGRNYYIDVSANASKAPEAPKKEETKKSKASKADKPKATKPNKVSDHVATRKAAATARKEAQQNLTYKYTPIGTGYFGDIYNQFKGRFNDAFDLLVENQGGEATAVFNRPEIGDIDLVWGDKKGGLAHIIDKHTGKDKSFSNNSEAKTVISDIINNGTVVFQDGDKVVIKSGHKQVTLRRNIREKGKKIADKNWLLTAYDETKADSTSAISATNQGRAAQPTNVTRGKNSKETDKNKTQIQDFGEKIEGARKDVYKTLAKAFDDATLQSLLELPFSKSFKRPDLAKLVESGVLREEDALYAEAFMTVYLSVAKPKPTKSDERMARIYGRPTKVTLWAEEAYKRIQQLQEFMLADNAKRDEIIASFAKPEAEQAAREEREYQERIGGRGPLRSPNPVGVIAEVLNRIGYSAGDTVKIDCPLVRVNSTFSRYELRLPDGSRNYQVPTAADLEEAITNLVMIAKMRRGDNDVQYHKEQFAVRGDTPIIKGNGKFVVGYIKKNGGVDHKRFSSEAEAKEFAAKQTGETVMREEQEVVGYKAYKVRFQKPLDGDFFVLSKSYPTREAALEAIENNLAELSAEANTFVAAKTDYEKNKKKAQDDLQIKILIDRDTRKPQYFVSTKRGEQVSDYFDSSAEARKYLAENKEAIQKRMEELKEARSKFVYFSSQGEPRVGEDYRKGADATPEMFQDTFGFRGVQFGNWTNARDRQEALNQAYDGFMDLASVLGVSPRALSLAGELGLAFGARGGGSAAAHYELKDVVINLTKTKGAGSLAHEWWHALDNYFARQAGISQGMATKAKQLPGVRPEVKKAFDDIVKTVNNTFYAKRSKAKGNYWGSEIELTARLFGEWVVYELAKTGRSNHFLSRGITPETFEEFKRMNYAFYEWARRDKNITIMPYEEFANTPSALEDMSYPTKEETEQMGVKVRELFDTLQEREEGDRTILFRDAEVEYTEEEEAIIDKAIADSTYLKAPNGQPTNLTPKQWAQVRTKAFKEWFGDWEQAARIEKLRKQLPVEISGSEVPFNEDIALYRKNAEQYAKKLRGTYTNRDTGNVIDLTRSGITELKQHDATSVAHLQSFAAIPQLIEQSIYITTLPNEDVKVKADSFDYYVSGLRIGGEDYTAKIVVANIGGKRYYDHKLSAIEKGSLLDLIRIPNLNQEQQTAISEFKDKRLVSILQTNSSKIVDANGEPKVVEHSTWNEDFNTFDIERLGESSGDEGLYGAGFYFGNVGHTALYGDRSIQAYLNMERPLALPEDNIMRSFDYLVENFDKQGLRDIIVKGGGKSQSATMGEIIDIIKDVQARHSTGEYDELIEQMSQYWYPADDRVIEQTIFKKVGFAFYRALTPFIENNIGRREFTEALSKAGYDGVVYDNTEWVVYKPDQIKSATDNVGTFDSTNDDIRYREDRNGQPIGDGSVHFPYEVVDFSGYPQISHRVSESAGTESVYVTYTNEDTGAKATVRFSGHENNATKFGDQLRGWYSNSPIKQQMENELKYRLGLVDKKNIYAKYIPTSQVSNKALAAGTHPEADKTIQELYELPVGTDLAQYKGKLAKGSRYLITGDKVEEDRNRVASVVYIPKVEPRETIATRIIAEAQQLAATHNVPIEIHETREEITDSNSSMQRRKRASFGWFDPAEGKVHLVLPSHDSVEELQSTFYHEAVAHYGLPKLLGAEQFTALCGNVWTSLPAITQKRLIRKYPNADVNTMAEEYMATIAEGNITPGLFQRIIAFVREAFRKMGVNIRISDNDIAYLLWRSKNNLQRARTASQKATVIAADKRMRKALSIDRERVRARSQYTEEEAAIIDKAIADGTYLKAPNGQPTNLTPKQWVQVRTKAFKEWFGDWEKAVRIKKLRSSEDAVISGDEIAITDYYKQNKKNALKYSQSFTGQYKNNDTGAIIGIYRGRQNGGINEVLQHNYKDVAHIQSVAAIPQIIEKSIYIESQPNYDIEKNPDVTEYMCFVCGLNISGEEHTVLAKVAVDKNGNRYYDHNLTAIAKGKLIDIANNEQSAVTSGFGTTPDTKSTTNSQRKYKDLVSILQTNSSKIVDANGEPKVVYHGTSTTNRRFFKFKQENPIWATPNAIYAEAFQEPNKRSFLYELFANIRQPLYVGNIDGLANEESLQELSKFSKISLETLKSILRNSQFGLHIFEITNHPQFKKMLIKQGYDGLQAIEGRTTSFAAFAAKQIKSATENNGNFDPGNDDIRFRDAEEPGADIAKEVTEELRKEDVPAESMARIAKRRILDKYGKKYPHLQALYETDNALEAAMVTEGFSTHTSKQLKAGAELLDMFERDLAIDKQREQGLLPKEVELEPKTIAEIDKRYGVNSTAKFYLYSDEHRNDARLRPENAVDTATMQLTISNEEFNKILDTNDADTLKLYRETLNNLLTAENGPFADEETVREEISKRFIAEGPTQGNVDESANKLGPYKQLRKAIKGRIRQIDDKLKVLSNAEVKPQIISKEELIERLHRPTETEKGSDKLSLREKIYLGVFDVKAQVKQFQEALAAEGINITSAMDYYSAENRTSSIAEVEKNRFQRNFANPLKNQINELAAAFDESGADPYYIVSTYALAEHSIERHSSGISALSSDDGEGQWNLENTTNIVRLFREDIAEYTIEKYAKYGKDAFSEEELRTLSPATRAKVEQGVEVDSLTDSEKMEIGEVKIEVLWRLINRLNDETLNIAQRAGLKSREEIALIKSHNWKYYVPLRDFDLDFENLTDPTEMLDNTFAQRKRSSTVFLPKAEGRTTKAADPFGQMIRTGQQFILVAETNKAKQRLLNLLVKATAQLPHATTAKYFEVGTRYMWKSYNEYLGKFVWREISDIDDFPPYEEMEKSKWAREKVRTLKSAMIQAAQNQDWQARNYYYQKMKEYEAEETIRFEYSNMDFNNEVRMSSVIDQTRIVEVWVNGRKQLMKFKDPAIAMAINGLSAVNESALFSAVDKVVGTPTRWLAKVRTQLSPDFIVTNAIRDFRHALRMHYLDAENGRLKGFVNNYNTKTAKAINRGIRGKASPLTINELRNYRLSNPDHIQELATLYGEDRVMDTLFDLFQSYGGQTGFAFAEDTKTIERDIRREYAREKAMRSERPVVRAWGKSREAASVVSEAFKMGSEVVENMSRFATFLANIEAGRTAEEAAQAAKEITVNFNRRGRYAKTLGGLYIFFNATMQAMAQVYRVGKENPKRLAALAIYEVAKGFAIAMLAELIKGDDDKEVPAYTLKENLVIPLPGGKYLKFPEPQTFSVFHGIGVDLAQAALGKISNAEVANNLIHSVLEASLYGYTEGGTDMALEVLIPSIAEPFVDVARNKNAFGSQIHPEDNWGLTPDSELGNRNTNELIYLICKSLNQLGGGNEVRPAGMTDDGDIIQFINLLDVNPANVEYIINQFAGGSIYGGKFAQQLWRLAASLVSDSEATLKDVPMLNRILGTLDTATPNSAYYREKERIENAYSVMNKENKAGMDVDPIQLKYHTRRRNYIKYIQKQIDAVREVQYSHKVNSEAYNAYKEIVEDYMRLCVKALNNADWTSGAERKREQYINSLYKEYGIESKLQTLNEKYGN